MHDLCRRTAVELAGLIRSGEVSFREVVEAHLARIDEVNGIVNAVVNRIVDTALAAADAADADAVPRDVRTGPLHGVPFTIKENLDCVGSPMTVGVPLLANALPSMDSPVVERMKAAGAVPLARTNLPEMGSGIGRSRIADVPGCSLPAATVAEIERAGRIPVLGPRTISRRDDPCGRPRQAWWVIQDGTL